MPKLTRTHMEGGKEAKQGVIFLKLEGRKRRQLYPIGLLKSICKSHPFEIMLNGQLTQGLACILVFSTVLRVDMPFRVLLL